MCLCNQLCKMQYLWPELLGNPPLVALPLLLFQLMRLPCGRHPLPVRMYGLMYGEIEEHFSVFLHPNGVSAWALQEEAQKLF